MPSCIALLRGVNMGGHKKIAMSDLRDVVAELGLANPRTLLQSGNLVFASTKSAAALEALLEKELAKRLDLTTTVFVRTAPEWAKIVRSNPFTEEAKRDPSHLALFLLKDKPAAKAVAALRDCIVGREVFEARGREMYAFFPDGFGKTKFTTALIDRKLATVVTARNWNTVLKLAAASALKPA
jgi:uncharacterized protein (DUF1697 family)